MTTENLNKALIKADGIETEQDYLTMIRNDMLTARDLCLGAMNSSFAGSFNGSLTDTGTTIGVAKQTAEDWAVTNYQLLNSIISAVESLLDRSEMRLDTFLLHMNKE